MGLNAIRNASEFDDQKEKADALKVALESNSAAVAIKTKNWKDALKHTDSILKDHPSNVKALYRKGTALSALDEWSESQAVFNKALEIEPDNKDVKRELAKLQLKQKKQNQKDKAMFQRMFK